MYKLKLREIRLYKNLSQDDIAKLTGIPQSTISYMENRLIPIDLDTLEKMSIVLKVKMKDFFIQL
ncbi:helix-turn-helix domain-containing protein [Vallitalea guaymasensis]|uniref:helix-turn-helix domain-containing protein n=1 Tax=Vallitalea guaymasensis TaxID=1185412 RepID=UPI000DE25F1E|nr:helix-turn-helix transcriptional regulator [Vallitalea guaymasensis]